MHELWWPFTNPTQSQYNLHKKRLELQINANSIPDKINSTQEIPQLTRQENEIKSVTFNNVADELNYQKLLDNFGTPPNYSPTPPHYQLKDSKANGRDKYVKPTGEEDPIISFQKRIIQPTPPPYRTNQPTAQQYSIEGRCRDRGRGRGAYARYGGRRGGHDSEREPHPFPIYSTIQDKGPKSTITLDTQEDITLDSESERSANWKD